MCIAVDDIRDATVTEKYIRRDVVKLGEGGTTNFSTVCKTCHGGPIDQWSTAFIHHDVSATAISFDRIDPVPVDNKMMRTINHSSYIPKNDEWFLELTENQRNMIGVPDGATGGFGAKSLGKFISSTGAFAKCQPQKAFKAVCGRVPDKNDTEFVKALVKDFVGSGFKLKGSFAKAAVYCAGGYE
jgi:hypothetical protein